MDLWNKHLQKTRTFAKRSLIDAKDIFYSLKMGNYLVDFKVASTLPKPIQQKNRVHFCHWPIRARYKLIAIIQFYVERSFFRDVCLFIVIRFGLKSYAPRMRVRAHNNIIANDLLIKHFLNVPHMIHIPFDLISLHFFLLDFAHWIKMNTPGQRVTTTCTLHLSRLTNEWKRFGKRKHKHSKWRYFICEFHRFLPFSACCWHVSFADLYFELSEWLFQVKSRLSRIKRLNPQLHNINISCSYNSCNSDAAQFWRPFIRKKRTKQNAKRVFYHKVHRFH